MKKDEEKDNREVLKPSFNKLMSRVNLENVAFDKSEFSFSEVEQLIRKKTILNYFKNPGVKCKYEDLWDEVSNKRGDRGLVCGKWNFTKQTNNVESDLADFIWENIEKEVKQQAKSFGDKWFGLVWSYLSLTANNKDSDAFVIPRSRLDSVKKLRIFV